MNFLFDKENEFLLEICDIVIYDFSRVLSTKCVETAKEYFVKLEGIWGFTEVYIKNRIRLANPFVEDEKTLIVDNNNGVIVVEPNTLVSSTTLVQALFCTRKAVLAEKFRQPGMNIQMTLGNVCHELFQQVLRRRPKIVSDAWLLAEFRRFVLPTLLLDLVILNVTCDAFETQLKPYLTNITTWMRTYMPPPFGRNAPLSDKSVIADIEDIEMNIQSKGLGIKGRIDVVLRTTKNRIVPLELKTGQSKVSTDHHAQVLMYTALLAELGDGKPDNGILLYLKDGTERVVTPKISDLKGMLQTRNGMATFSAALDIERFPEPRPDTRLCAKCAFAPHCTTLQRLSTNKSHRISEEMQTFAKNFSQHLTKEELEYGKQWLEWIFMEWKAERKRGNNVNVVFPMQLNSVIMLLEETKAAKRLREFIVDLKEPSFGSFQKSDIEKIKPIVKKLSVTQAKAVVKALSAKDYILIQGFPGSGKTSTIVALVESLVALGKSVLITAYTNSAVDNMLLRLQKVLPEESMLRIGGNDSTARLEQLKPLLLESKLASFTDRKTMVAEARNMLQKIPVVATTCLTAGSHAYFTWRTKFDYCIVDEAALALQSSLIKPLLLGNVYVLVGDTRQLEPLVVSQEAKEKGMNISLMERWEKVAEKVNGVIKLNQQYRMNRTICRVSSHMFYEGLLQCANEEVATQTLAILEENKERIKEEVPTQNSSIEDNKEGIKEEVATPIEDSKEEVKDEKPKFVVPEDLKSLVLSPKLSDSVIFIDTLSRISDSNSFVQCKSETSSRSNQGEVELLSKLCEAFIEAGISPSSIGAMSTYRDQVDELRKALPTSIETNTVDQYQGRDKDIILISLVHTSTSDAEATHESLLSDRRINVALTRAKKKLVIIGCLESLSNFPLMKRMVQNIDNVYKFYG